MDHRAGDQWSGRPSSEPATLALGVVVGHRRVDQHQVAARPDAAAGVRDGEVAGDGRVHDQHVGLAGDRAAAVVGPVAVQGRVVDGHVAVQREDRAARPVGVAAVDERVDHRHVAVLVGVQRAAVAVGGVAVDERADHEDVAGRADRAARPVDQVGAEHRVVDLDAAAPGVDAAAVVVGQVAVDVAAACRDPAHREDAAARLLRQVLLDHAVGQQDLPARGQRRPGPVGATAGQGDVADVEEPVPSWRSSRFSKQVCLIV